MQSHEKQGLQNGQLICFEETENFKSFVSILFADIWIVFEGVSCGYP